MDRARVVKPDELALWRELRSTGDVVARDRLVERHIGVVKSAAAWVAGRLPSHLRLDDLYAAGMLGFLDALEDFDPDRGVPFSSYAVPRIRGAIFDELRRLDVVPRRVRRRLRQAQHAVETLSQRLDREPDDTEIAAELGLDLAAYHHLLEEGVTLLSLENAGSADDDRLSPLDTLSDTTTPDPGSTLDARELRRVLTQCIDTLPDRERQVLALYYYEELTMQEAGQVLGVTESRVSQIHSSAIIRLRAALRRRRLDADLTPREARR